MRLPRATSRSTPVYAGWQFEHTSRTSSAWEERVVNSFPQVVQRTLVTTSSGCLLFIGSPLKRPCDARPGRFQRATRR
jgi:hypothetical protein